MAAPAALMALVTAMTVWINATTGLPIPENIRMAYGEMPPGIAGMYLDEQEVVVMSPTWTGEDLKDRAILLHELVHAMQDEAGKMDVRPLCRGDIEREAYMTMFKYLEANGRADIAIVWAGKPQVQAAMAPCTLAETMPIGGPR